MQPEHERKLDNKIINYQINKSNYFYLQKDPKYFIPWISKLFTDGPN